MSDAEPTGAGRRPTSARRRVLARALCLVAMLQLGIAAGQWLVVPTGRERGIDVSASYVAAGLWLEGAGDQLYNQDTEARRHAAINAPGYRTDLPFITPPLTAVAAAPARLLGPDVGLRALSIAEVLALLGALVIAARAAEWPRKARGQRPLAVLLGFAAIPTLPLLLMGQWDGICALGLACAYAAWRRDRPFLAGLVLALGIGLAKPHLGVALAAFILGRRDVRALGGAAVGTLSLVAASLVLVGPTACANFLGALRLSLAHSPPATTLGASGFVASWLGVGALTTVLTAILSALAAGAALVLGWRSARGWALEPCLAGATALTLVATPHVLSHDLVILGPAFVWMGAWACARRALTAGPLLPVAILATWALFDGVSLVDLGNGSPAPPGRLVPLVLVAIAGMCTVAAGRAGDVFQTSASGGRAATARTVRP